jgi:hypothetical protein
MAFLKESDQIIARMGSEIVYLEQLCNKIVEEKNEVEKKFAEYKKQHEVTDAVAGEPDLPFEAVKTNGKDKKQNDGIR